MTRARYYQLKITPNRRLLITARKFRTQKANRSKIYKQIVIGLPYGRFKEISIRQQRRRPKHFQFIRRPVVIPSMFIIAGMVGVGLFGWQSLHVNKLDSVRTFSVASNAAPAKPVKPKSLPRSVPTRIVIPSIGVDAGIMQVGRAPDGSLETPPVLEYITGWYRYSPTPGEIGPSVIVGHVDSYKGISVFWRLRELKPADEIDITRTDGRVVKFTVDALQQFDQANFPTKEVYGNINHAGLRLITCGGTFDTSTGQYNQNTVVFASMVP